MAVGPPRHRRARSSPVARRTIPADARPRRAANTWAKEAQALGLHGDEAVESARLLTQNVPDAFCEARKKSGLEDEAAGFADRLVDAVARNAAFCLTRLG